MGFFDSLGKFAGNFLGGNAGNIINAAMPIVGGFFDKSAQKKEARGLEQLYRSQNPFDPYREQYAQRLNQFYDDPSGALNRIPGYQAAAQGIIDQVGGQASARGLNYSTSTLVDMANKVGQLGLQAGQNEQRFLGDMAGGGFRPGAGDIGEKAAQLRADKNRPIWGGVEEGLKRLGGINWQTQTQDQTAYSPGGDYTPGDPGVHPGIYYPGTPGINPNAPSPGSGGYYGDPGIGYNQEYASAAQPQQQQQQQGGGGGMPNLLLG
jgi:hypothetical protein